MDCILDRFSSVPSPSVSRESNLNDEPGHLKIKEFNLPTLVAVGMENKSFFFCLGNRKVYD